MTFKSKEKEEKEVEWGWKKLLGKTQSASSPDLTWSTSSKDRWMLARSARESCEALSVSVEEKYVLLYWFEKYSSILQLA